MKVIVNAARRSRATLAIFALVLLFGLYAKSQIRVANFPDISVPVVVATVRFDGLSPADGARLIAKPIENELTGVGNIKQITINAADSVVLVLVEYEIEVPMQKALSDTREALDRAKYFFPAEAREPNVREISTSPYPIIIVALSTEQADERRVYQLARDLQNRIEQISGVLEVNLSGHRDEVLEVLLSPEQMAHYNITTRQLFSALAANNLVVPAGEAEMGGGRFSVKLPSLIESADDVRRIPLLADSDGAVTLGDIATIRRTFRDAERFTRINGKNAIALEVMPRAGSDQVAIPQQVRQLLADLPPETFAGIEVTYIFDQSIFAISLVNEMMGNIGFAMMLVMIVVVAALGLRPAILVGVGIPFSILVAITLVYSLGWTFNFMVAFGLLLALGMLIDGAIVVIEYAENELRDGRSPWEAYANSVKRMAWPVIASTATTLAAFIPLMIWPDLVGKFMRFLPVTVFAVLAGSLVYALFFAPVIGILTYKFSRPDKTQKRALFDRLGDLYAAKLGLLMRHPWRTSVGSLLMLIAIFMLYGRFSEGVMFFTESDESYGTAAIHAQGNLTLQEKLRLTREVERRMLAVEGVKQIYANAGGSSVALGGGKRDSAPDTISSILIELVWSDYREEHSRVIYERLRKAVSDIPGIWVEVDPMEGGPPIGKPIQIQINADDEPSARIAARWMLDRVEAEPDMRGVISTLPLAGIEWKLEIDSARAAEFGITSAQVGNVLQMVTGGYKLGEYRPDDAEEEVEIRLRYPGNERTLNNLEQILISTPAGQVPSSVFAKLTPVQQVQTITRNDGRYTYKVMADTEEGVLADAKVKVLQEWLSEQTVPAGAEIEFRGANEEQEKSMAFLSVAFSTSLFLMAIILVTQYNSWYQVLVTVYAVVMSTCGVLLGILITGQTFSVIMTGVGVVALAGIVVNNNIVLIDTFNYLRKQQPHLTAIEAATESAKQRFRPVLLTSGTTVLGLLPLSMHISIDILSRNIVQDGAIGSTWVPLAGAIVHGLTFATLLTLLVTPAMLCLPDSLRNDEGDYLWTAWLKQKLNSRSGTADSPEI